MTGKEDSSKAQIHLSKKKAVASIALAINLALLVYCISPTVLPSASAIESCEPEDDENPTDGTRVTVEDVGIFQLVDHDLYNVNRQTGNDSEDERLNLSTLYDHGEENIANGGEHRNSQNPIVHSVAIKLAKTYLGLVNDGVNEEEARELTVEKYLRKVEGAYERAFPGEEFPEPLDEEEGEEGPEERQEGNAALRTTHVFLPGEIMVDGKLVSLEEIPLDTILTGRELKQESRAADDSYDPVLLDLDLQGGPSDINLLERDTTFVEEFTDLDYEAMLCELADGQYDANDLSMELLRDEFAEAQAEEEES